MLKGRNFDILGPDGSLLPPYDPGVNVYENPASLDPAINTPSIQAAVTYCYNEGLDMYWRTSDTYAINASIDSLHDIRHHGNAKLQRGSDVWYVSPRGEQANVLYVSTNGSDTNDGLTSEKSLRTGQKAVVTLDNYRPTGLLPGTWVIDLSAGQYDRIRFPDEGLYSENNIQVRGAPRDVSSGNVWFVFVEGTETGLMTVGGTMTGGTSGATATITHVFSGKNRVVRADIVSGTPLVGEIFTDSLSSNSGQTEYLSPTPTTTIREGSTQSAFGVLGTEMELQIDDILIEDCNGSLSSVGLSMRQGGKIYGNNLHTYDCYWGVSGANNSTINLKGGVIYDNGFLNSSTGGGAGIRGLFFPQFEVGTQNNGDRSKGPLIFANSVGIRAQEGGKGHVDWALVYGNISGGIRCLVSSRINASGSEIDGNGGSGTYVTRGSHIDDDGNCKFSNNSRNSSVGMASTVGNYISGYSVANGASACVIDTEHPTSGNVYTNTSSVDVHSLSIAQEALEDAQFTGIAAKRIVYRAMGTLSGSVGTYKRFVLRVGGIPTVLSFGSGVSGSFDVDLMVEFIGQDRQFVCLSGHCSTTPNCTVANITAATDGDIAVEFEVLVQNSSDSITIERYEITQVGF